MPLPTTVQVISVTRRANWTQAGLKARLYARRSRGLDGVEADVQVRLLLFVVVRGEARVTLVRVDVIHSAIPTDEPRAAVLEHVGVLELLLHQQHLAVSTQPEPFDQVNV